MALSALTTLASAMVAVLKVFLGLELKGFHLLLKTANVLDLPARMTTSASMSILPPKREGALRRVSSFFLCYFSFAESSFRCC